MRVSHISNVFANNSLIKLKDEIFLFDQRSAGRIAADTLILLAKMVQEKTTNSLLELDKVAEEHIMSCGGAPTFKGYKGFPASVCISVDNKTTHQLVHGIPTDYKPIDGDMISFDLGVTVNGAIADTAITVVFGEASKEQNRLIRATEECLQKGIAAVKIGSQIGAIGHAISMCAKNWGYSVINQYGGHGICISKDGEGIPHASPFIANKANMNEGVRIQSGLVIAIEPLLTTGSTETSIEKDSWTVITRNMSCHFEHSIFVHEDYSEIITKR